MTLLSGVSGMVMVHKCIASWWDHGILEESFFYEAVSPDSE